ncbi:MAG: fumarylacetoacetate (FAA) hydrolase [Bradyrhizobium sp.]|jgi:fumarylacetoacetate (FAA) hydrolase
MANNAHFTDRYSVSLTNFYWPPVAAHGMPVQVLSQTTTSAVHSTPPHSSKAVMKLATLKDGTRDGQLAVVSRDLKTAVLADAIAPTLQRALDDWNFIAPQLDDLYAELNADRASRSFAFDPGQCMAPLPRAFQWADGSAYVNHVELVRKARNAELPDSFWHEPLMYQGGSDDFIGPTDDIVLGDAAWGIDFEGEVAVITGDVPMGSDTEQSGRQIRLLMLVNDVSLRNLIPVELAKGFGFVQSKPASAFSPVAVTPDELGSAWKDSKVHLPLRAIWNEALVGQPDAGTDMVFSFARLVEHLALTRNVRAGSIIGSGTVSNKDARKGYTCIAEKRCLEMIATGVATTPFMQFGDRIKIEMLDAAGKSIFGAINQQLTQAAPVIRRGRHT